MVKLPPGKKLALARWLQAQLDDRLADEDMMAIAAEGARARDDREFPPSEPAELDALIDPEVQASGRRAATLLAELGK